MGQTHLMSGPQNHPQPIAKLSLCCDGEETFMTGQSCSLLSGSTFRILCVLMGPPFVGRWQAMAEVEMERGVMRCGECCSCECCSCNR